MNVMFHQDGQVATWFILLVTGRAAAFAAR
jgi:hypothetical protein